MLVSVIITSFNYARYLGESIDSALAQDHPDVEVIVVDDGSTDNSREVMAAYGDRITAITKSNGGQPSAFNAGFAASSGSIVIFLDSDDALDLKAASRFVDAMSRPDIAQCYGYLEVVDETGQALGRRMPGRPGDQGDLRSRAMDFGPVRYICPPTSGNAWNRAFLEEIMPLPEERAGSADNYLFSAVPLFGLVHAVDATVARYRYHEKSDSERLAGFDGRALREAYVSFSQEAAFLARYAQRKGVQVRAADWEQRHWRVLLIKHMLNPGPRSADGVPLRQLLGAARRTHAKGLRKAVLLALLPAIYFSPSWLKPLSARLVMPRRLMG